MDALIEEREAFSERERVREELNESRRSQINLDKSITNLDMEIYSLRKVMLGEASTRLVSEKDQDRKTCIRERNRERTKEEKLKAYLELCIERYNRASDNAFLVQLKCFETIASGINESQIKRAMLKKIEKFETGHTKRLSLYIDYESNMHLVVGKPANLVRDGSDCWHITVSRDGHISVRRDRTQEDIYLERLAWAILGWHPPFTVYF